MRSLHQKLLGYDVADQTGIDEMMIDWMALTIKANLEPMPYWL